ncbi:MAG TPA: Fic family protein [Candidatus Aphodovivens avistercoris]|nr:Fic family protein [Candidatus Aphodovivens avistercoris]
MLYEGSYEAFAKSGGVKEGSIYSPRPIGNRNFVFRNETLATMADAEIGYARLDERSTHFPYNSALRRILANLEAMATISVDGIKPDLEAMLAAESAAYARKMGYDAGAHRIKVLSDKQAAATKAAIRYYDAIHQIASGPSRFEFTQEMLLGLHARLMYEPEELDSVDRHFRQKPYRMRISSPGRVRNVYLAPAPEDVPALVEDVLQFCNKPNLSPVMQAAVAHFHLEAIRPFKTGMDRTGRAFCHMIIRKRELYRHIIPPIALVPATNVPSHATLLFPYRTNKPFTEREAALALDRWTLHCAECTVMSVRVVNKLAKRLSELEESWRARLPRVRKGGAVDLLLCELPGMPIITVSAAMAITGKGFSASNDAVHQLAEAGIIAPTGNGHRNRSFIAEGAVRLMHEVTDQTIPTELVSRESVFA